VADILVLPAATIPVLPAVVAVVVVVVVVVVVRPRERSRCLNPANRMGVHPGLCLLIPLPDPTG